jgi:hypothetical protein
MPWCERLLMADTILCPHCNKEIPLSDAVTHTLREGIEKEYGEKRRALEQSVTKQREEIEKQRAAVELAKQEIDAQVQQKLGAEREKLKSMLKQEAAASVSVEMRDLKTELEEKRRTVEEAQKLELSLRKQQRELEERAKAQDLEIERKLATERTRIQEETRRLAIEEQQLRFADKEKLIGDLKTQIETLKQKAEQGSQQSQGEVQEMQLEELLKQMFPHDEFVPVPTGTRGADLLQKVRNPMGQPCGTIIWESKRTKLWSRGWLDKLKEDQRAQAVELAILVSQALPEGVAHFSHIEGVWVCGYTLALPLAAALRHQLVAVSASRRAESGKGEKMEALYHFISSTAFQHQVQGVAEAFMEMQNDLSRERVAMEKLWKKREKLIQRVLNGTAGLQGSLEGIVGRQALPAMKVLELDGGEESAEE